MTTGWLVPKYPVLLLAFRNILRTPRRTLVTLFLIVSGTFLVSAMRFLSEGLQFDMISHAVQLDSGLLEITAYGWNEHRSLSRALETTPGFLERVKVEGVRAVSPRIRSGAVMNAGERTRFVSVFAADPASEREITTLHKFITAGGPAFDAEIPGALIGYKLARTMDLKPASRFYLITTQFDGSVGAVEAQVSGIFRADQTQLDTARVMLALATGEKLFGTNMTDDSGTAAKRYFTSVALGVEDQVMSAQVRERLQAILPPPKDLSGARPGESKIYDPVVLDWEQLNPEVKEILKIAGAKLAVFLFFFAVSISFGVLNTLQMSIQERLKELGVMLAIGTTPQDLRRMILYEVALLVIPGVCVGIAGSTLLALYLHGNPIDLTGTTFGKLYESMQIPPRFKPILDMGKQVQLALALTLPAFFMGWAASRRLFQLNPVTLINTL
ncbi:MAG: ABC transporter permease [Spirochaetia bacterium]|nr:ABC transporter permease [Spirochaetia bacterium]